MSCLPLSTYFGNKFKENFFNVFHICKRWKQEKKDEDEVHNKPEALRTRLRVYSLISSSVILYWGHIIASLKKKRYCSCRQTKNLTIRAAHMVKNITKPGHHPVKFTCTSVQILTSSSISLSRHLCQGHFLKMFLIYSIVFSTMGWMWGPWNHPTKLSLHPSGCLRQMWRNSIKEFLRYQVHKNGWMYGWTTCQH